MEQPEFLKDTMRKRAKMYLSKLRRGCKRCSGDGALYNLEDMTYINCPECVDVFFSKKVYLESNIPPDYINITTEDLQQNYEDEFFKKYKIILDKCEDILAKTGLVFHRANDNSFGVSTAGIRLLKQLIDLDYETYYVDVNDLFASMFSFGNTEELNMKRSTIMEYYNNVQCILIDNFGMEVGKKQYSESFVYQKFCAMISNRCLNGKFTIICTDLKQDEFKKTYQGHVLTTMRKHVYPVDVKSKNTRKKDKSSIMASIDPVFKETGVYTEQEAHVPIVISGPPVKVKQEVDVTDLDTKKNKKNARPETAGIDYCEFKP